MNEIVIKAFWSKMKVPSSRDETQEVVTFNAQLIQDNSTVYKVYDDGKVICFGQKSMYGRYRVKEVRIEVINVRRSVKVLTFGS